MTVDETLRTAVMTVVPICVQAPYAGNDEEKADTYCDFSYFLRPAEYLDNEPHAIVYDITLRYYAPLGVNTAITRREIRRAISSAGFTYPTETNITDGESQGYAYEFSYSDGDF